MGMGTPATPYPIRSFTMFRQMFDLEFRRNAPCTYLPTALFYQALATGRQSHTKIWANDWMGNGAHICLPCFYLRNMSCVKLLGM